MSMRPIDIQSIMANTKEVEKIQQAAQTRQQDKAQRFEGELEKKALQQSKQVRDLSRSESLKIDKKTPGQEPRKRRRKKAKPAAAVEADTEGEIYDPQAGLHRIGPDSNRDLLL